MDAIIPTAPSMASLLANNRYVAITTAAFDVNSVFLRTARGIDRLGEPFTISARLISTGPIQNFGRVAGRSMTIGLLLPDGNIRYCNGIITRFEYIDHQGAGRLHYMAEIRPWLVLLGNRRNFRIFQNKTSVEIITAIFQDHPESLFRSEVREDLPSRSFCVQYDETDFAFVSRLMEEDGLYYYFEHAEGSHELVLVDNIVAHPVCEPEVVETILNGQPLGGDYIWNWRETIALQPQQIRLSDYDHEKPEAELTCFAQQEKLSVGPIPAPRPGDADSSTPLHSRASTGADAMIGTTGDLESQEVFEFPGRYRSKVAGIRYARVRAEEYGCRLYRVRVESSVRRITTGSTFLAANPYGDADTTRATPPRQRYLAVAVDYTINGEVEGRQVGDLRSPNLYESVIEALPAATPYRSSRLTPLPKVAGPQTAIVAGSSNPLGATAAVDTVVTDDYGRIKVRFFWDRSDSPDDASSCWIRVAQGWAGKMHGGLVLPRVGDEVVVEFLHGNPDWPLVTGSVYNATNLPPEDLPLRSARSTFKTQTIGGNLGEFNELRFDDESGAEEVYLRAQRNSRIEVGHDEISSINNDRNVTVQSNDTLKSVTGSINVTAAQMISLSVGATVITLSAEGITMRTPGLVNTLAGAAITTTAGAAISVTAGAEVAIEAAADVNILGAGAVTIEGAGVMIDAGDGAVVCVPFPV